MRYQFGDEAANKMREQAEKEESQRVREIILKGVATQPAQGEAVESITVYEYDSPFGLHREFTPRSWNGERPDRAVTYYPAPPATIPQSEHDALKAEHDKVLARVRELEFNDAEQLKFDGLMAEFHAAVWEAAASEEARIDYDMAGVEIAKKIRKMITDRGAK